MNTRFPLTRQGRDGALRRPDRQPIGGRSAPRWPAQEWTAQRRKAQRAVPTFFACLMVHTLLATTPTPPGLDFGDASTNHPVRLAQKGAAHRIEPGFFLGTRVDAETDGQPSGD